MFDTDWNITSKPEAIQLRFWDKTSWAWKRTLSHMVARSTLEKKTILRSSLLQKLTFLDNQQNVWIPLDKFDARCSIPSTHLMTRPYLYAKIMSSSSRILAHTACISLRRQCVITSFFWVRQLRWKVEAKSWNESDNWHTIILNVVHVSRQWLAHWWNVR